MKASNPVKILIALFFLSLVSLGSNAQTRNWHIGLTAGADLFNVTGRSFEGKTKAGLSAGAYGEIKLARMWYIQPELLFNQAFTKTTDNFNQIYPGGISSDITLNYLTLPVMVAFKPIPELSLLAGGQYGYLLGQTTGLTPNLNKDNAFKKGDIGIIFGGQLNLGKVRFSARYIINVNDINGLNNSDLWRYHGFQFLLGYQIF